MSSPSPSRSVWVAWLDRLTEVGERFEADLATGGDAVLGELPAPPATGPDALPPDLLGRTTTVLDHLERLTELAQHRRDAIAAELATLPRQRRRPASGYDYEIGARLDIAG